MKIKGKLIQGQLWHSVFGSIVFVPTYLAPDGTHFSPGCLNISSETMEKIADKVFDASLRDDVRVVPFLGKAVGFTYYSRHVPVRELI